MKWHQFEASAVLKELNSGLAAGLSDPEIERLTAQYGRNELIATAVKNPWLILWEQFTSLMAVILILAAMVSALLADYADAIAITAIIIINAIIGFSHEFRAEKAIAALKKLAVPSVRVRRNGVVQELPSFNLVPGDIVLLEAGNVVGADCRLLEVADLQAQESALTGESASIRKTTAALSGDDVQIGDRLNMVFMGTFIVAGRGQAVVTGTGMNTELGQIATMIQKVDREETPLQRRLGQLGKRLAIVALLLVVLIFAIGLLRGEELRLMLLTAVSIGVAAIPEGLPTVVMIALALGAQRMLARNALIRKLPAVETLGSVTVICSDKTGTLTQNRMKVATIQLAEQKIEIDQNSSQAKSDQSKQPGMGILLAGCALCNDAVVPKESDAAKVPLGDPTETALAVVASEFGLWKWDLDRSFPRIGEIPFTSERKRMTTVHQVPSTEAGVPELTQICKDAGAPCIALTKGATDLLLGISDSIWVNAKIEPLNDEWRSRISTDCNAMAQDGMRVLGHAFRPLLEVPTDWNHTVLEQKLTYIGSTGIIDPPRIEVSAAVATCKAAGIRTVMITGDHPLTAQSIANQLGISSSGRILTGTDLDPMTDEALEQLSDETAVYARVSPQHKLKIIQSLQNRGHIVAMTGDGVNDAPALKKADIGVAMGVMGTDVAKEAADMVLLDDNFATIVAAVEEGRVIYDNIRKFVKFMLTTNSAEIWVMLLAPVLGMPIPLLPLQILWMNLITDGFPALALGVEPAERDTMLQPPHPPTESLFSRGLGRHVLLVGLLMGLVSLSIGYYYWQSNHPNWRTILFTTLTLSQMAHVLAIRSERQSLFQIGILSNKYLLAALLLTAVLQMGLIYVPFLQSVFSTSFLPAWDLGIAVAASSIIFWIVEMEKWVQRRKSP